MTAVLAAQALGAAGRGQLAAVMAPFSVVLWVLAGGLPYAVAAERRMSPPDVYPAVRASGLLLTGAFGLLGSALIAGWAFAMGADGLLSSYAIGAAALPFTMLLAVFVEYERQGGAGRQYNMARLLPSVGTALVVAALSIQGANSVSTFVAATVAPGAILLVLLAFLRVTLFSPPWRGWSRRAGGRLMALAVRAWPSAVTDTLLLRVDQVALSVLTESRGLGMYAVAATISEASGFLRAGICATEFASMAAAPDCELRDRRRRLHTRVLIATVPAYTLVGIATFPFAGLIFGSDFQAIGVLVAILLGAQVALDVHLTGGTILLAIGRPGVFSKVSMSGLFVHVVVLIPAASFAGATGAALASLAGYAAAGGLSFVACGTEIRAREGT